MYEQAYTPDAIAACVRDLRPELKAILDQEIERGNLVQEAGRGWPDDGSVFIQVRERFCARYQMAAGVEFRTLNDPHWWEQEYSCGKPVHLLVCPRG